MPWMSLVVAMLVMAVFSTRAAPGAEVFVEAESFTDRGGWVIDQQFMDQMGSPYLLAHGMGRPVADAATTVTFPAAGKYRVFVRTFDWVAPFKAKGSPGRFKLMVNGRAVGTVFGTAGDKWGWQAGPVVDVPAGKVKLVLHDLTGFAGRCDAIYFTTDEIAVPPNDPEPMARFRRRLLGLPETPPDAGEFDLVVVGGGVAGCCTAVAAARQGLSVALLQDRPVLGGNNSSEVRVCHEGLTNLPPFPNVGNILHEVCPPRSSNNSGGFLYGDGRKEAVVRAEDNIKLFLSTRGVRVEKRSARIVAVIGKDIATGRELRFPAKLFADCTGDGGIGALAGADFRMGREGRDQTGESMAPSKPDGMTMGMSNLWNARPGRERIDFPACPWAVQFDETTCPRDPRGWATHGRWHWESGLRQDKIVEAERIRDYNFRVIYGVWDFVKNRSPDRERYANHAFRFVAYIAGKRESRRLMGDVILTQQDVEQPKLYPDGCVTSTWPLDLHYPQPKNSQQFPGREFLTIATTGRRIKPYPIPYRCFYSRNVENLFMAGRNISVTHVALGTVRVMITTGSMGEVVGRAAALCKRHNATPREVYHKHLDELKALLRSGFQHIYIPFSGRQRVAMVGLWKKRFTRGGYGYASDWDRDKGKKTITFTPHIPADGAYEVSLRWPVKRKAAPAVPVTIQYAGGEKTFTVDMTKTANQWVKLATLPFKAGQTGWVRVANAGTTGFVVVEGALFRPVRAEP